VRLANLKGENLSSIDFEFTSGNKRIQT
jgi:hypothetical protein